MSCHGKFSQRQKPSVIRWQAKAYSRARRSRPVPPSTRGRSSPNRERRAFALRLSGVQHDEIRIRDTRDEIPQPARQPHADRSGASNDADRGGVAARSRIDHEHAQVVARLGAIADCEPGRGRLGPDSPPAVSSTLNSYRRCRRESRCDRARDRIEVRRRAAPRVSRRRDTRTSRRRSGPCDSAQRFSSSVPPVPIDQQCIVIECRLEGARAIGAFDLRRRRAARATACPDVRTKAARSLPARHSIPICWPSSVTSIGLPRRQDG